MNDDPLHRTTQRSRTSRRHIANSRCSARAHAVLHESHDRRGETSQAGARPRPASSHVPRWRSGSDRRSRTHGTARADKTKSAATTRPRRASRPGAHAHGLSRRSLSEGGRVPAAARRAVWRRDAGRCAFVGINGRCAETGFLEFHHVRPFAAGGATDLDNLQLRCRAHNAYEADLYFGGQLRPDGAATEGARRMGETV